MIRDIILEGLPLKDYEIIDAHSHLGVYTSFYARKPSLGEFVSLMDRLGIQLICTTGKGCGHNDYTEANEAVCKAAEEFPGRIMGYCMVNPWHPEEMEADLKKYAGRPGIMGIKIHPASSRYPVTGERYIPVWEYANENNMIVLSHTWETESTCAPEMFDGILGKYPGMKLLLGHSGGTRMGYEQSYRLLKKYPNVYMEICGFEYSSVWISEILENVPYERVIFGSDQNYLDPRFSFGRLALAEIPEEAKIAIFGGNMKKLLLSVNKYPSAGKAVN